MRPLDHAATYVRKAGPALRRLVLLPYVAGTELPSLSGSRFEPISFGQDYLSEYRSELIASLGAFRWRLWVSRSLVLLVRTLLLAAGLLLVATVFGVAGLLTHAWWPNYLVALALAGGITLIFRQRLSYFDVARVVDRQLGLKAQLGTAVQLTVEGEPNQIARSQVRQATAIARRLQPRQAIALRVPWQDLRLLTAVLVSLAAVSFLANLGLRAPEPDAASAARMEAIDQQLHNAWYEVDPAMAAGLTPEEKRATGLQGVIQDLKNRLSRNEITPLEYASQVAAVEDQIRQQAEESSRQQAALSDLADALKDTSATRSVAESLNRGEYGQAVQELTNLSQHTDRLSAQARQELADRLSEAAQRTADSNSQLADAAQRAAEALRKGDSAAAQQALRDLASAMASASQAVAPQSDLGEALRQLEEAQGGEQGQNGLGDGEMGSQMDPNGLGGSPGGEQGAGQEQGDQGSGRGSTSAQGSGSDKGGGAGTGKGERIVTNGAQNQPTRPEVTGNVLKISGKPSNSGTSVQTQGSGPVPLTTTSSGTASIQGSGGGSRSDKPVDAIGENNYVPLEMKPVVKDYFSGGER